VTPETHTIWQSALSLVAFLLWQLYSTTKRDVEALKAQNAKQETDLATLQANGNAHNLNTERLASAIERLDSKIDQLSQSLLQNRRASEKPHA
jgi:sucrose-6-phosphate hydrolase SacC (GH32 family)